MLNLIVILLLACSLNKKNYQSLLIPRHLDSLFSCKTAIPMLLFVMKNLNDLF